MSNQDAGSFTSGGPSANDKKPERRHALKLAVLAGIIGIVGTFSGSIAQSISADNAQEASFVEERAKEDRQHRADVYFAFLGAANNLADVRHALDYCGPKLDERCRNLWDSTKALMQEFQSARNQVFVYGSDDADSRADWIAQLLSDYRYMATYPVGTILNPVRPVPFPAGDFDVRYRAFLVVVCQEIPAQPRGNCG